MDLSPQRPTQRPAPAARHERGLAAFARISADWFWETDPDGRFVDFLGESDDPDLVLARRVGRTRRESASQDPENLARIDALDEIIAQRQPFRDVVYRAQLEGDPPTWCAISGEPVFGEAGEYLGYRGVGRNVNELVETQIALETKTRILDAVLAAMPDAIRVLDPDRRTISINDQFYRFFDLDKAAMEAAPDPLWYSFLEMALRGEYGDGDPVELARTRYALLGPDEFHYERQLKHGPWLEARGVPVPGGSRLTIYRDITERKRAEQAMRDTNAELERRVEERTAALAENERFYRATLDSIDARLAVLDGDGWIIATNGAWRRVAEVSSAAWHTAGDRTDYLTACTQTVGPSAEEARLVASAVREILAGQRQSFEVEYVCPDAESDRFFLCRAARVGAERPVRVVVTHDDVTVVRQAEQQARRAQRMEAIGTLAGGIAHDLNNALTPVVMGLELLSAEFPDNAGTIEMMAASARHGAEMLKQLLTFARGAEGRRLAVQPASLVGDVERIAKGTFPKSISLEVRLPSGLPVVQGDPTQLHQVLLNLCVNARDAMPDGGALTIAAEVVTVDEGLARTISGARAGEFVRLSVRDTGSGIAAADLDRIFDPFFTTKRLDQGTGLGLSTAMGIVKAHQGFMQVRSAPGHGSTFAVYLPFVATAAAPERPPVEGRRLRGRGELILVVDDEASIRQLYRAVLKQLGFDVITAEDGADGLIQAERHQASLSAIITDVLMPNMDGPSFIRELRERGIEIPVAIASGRMEDHQIEELDRLKVNARLGKPFTQKRLMAALEQLLVSRAVSARS